jgi:hypothetical protein
MIRRRRLWRLSSPNSGRSIRALRDAIRDVAPEQHDIVTPEQVAGRLSITMTKLTRAMNGNILPRGVVWFETPLGRFVSWRRLVEWITTADASSSGTPDEMLNEDEVWRKPA